MARRRATYSGDPKATPLDAARFWLTDTDVDNARFSDAEIEFVLCESPEPMLAAADLLLTESVKFSNKSSVSIGPISKQFGEQAKNLLATSKSLRARALRSAKPFAGGLSRQGKFDLSQDPDAVQPRSSVDFMDDPTAVQLNDDLNDLRNISNGS